MTDTNQDHDRSKPLAGEIKLYDKSEYIVVKVVLQNPAEDPIDVHLEQSLPAGVSSSQITFPGEYHGDSWSVTNGAIEFATEIDGRSTLRTAYGTRDIELSTLVDRVNDATVTVTDENGETLGRLTGLQPEIAEQNDEETQTEDTGQSTAETENTGANEETDSDSGSSNVASKPDSHPDSEDFEDSDPSEAPDSPDSEDSGDSDSTDDSADPVDDWVTASGESTGWNEAEKSRDQEDGVDAEDDSVMDDGGDDRVMGDEEDDSVMDDGGDDSVMGDEGDDSVMGDEEDDRKENEDGGEDSEGDDENDGNGETTDIDRSSNEHDSPPDAAENGRRISAQSIVTNEIEPIPEHQPTEGDQSKEVTQSNGEESTTGSTTDSDQVDKNAEPDSHTGDVQEASTDPVPETGTEQEGDFGDSLSESSDLRTGESGELDIQAQTSQSDQSVDQERETGASDDTTDSGPEQSESNRHAETGSAEDLTEVGESSADGQQGGESATDEIATDYFDASEQPQSEPERTESTEREDSADTTETGWTPRSDDSSSQEHSWDPSSSDSSVSDTTTEQVQEGDSVGRDPGESSATWNSERSTHTADFSTDRNNESSVSQQSETEPVTGRTNQAASSSVQPRAGGPEQQDSDVILDLPAHRSDYILEGIRGEITSSAEFEWNQLE